MITIHCTGKGDHKRRELYWVDPASSPLRVHGYVFGKGTTSHNRRSGRVQRGRKYRLRCPSCPRRNHVYWEETLKTLLAGLVAAGVSSFDLSNLPC